VRKNIYGGDLCAHAELVKSDFWQTKRNNYLYYFFINSSARGPFVPNYWTSKWYIHFLGIAEDLLYNESQI